MHIFKLKKNQPKLELLVMSTLTSWDFLEGKWSKKKIQKFERIFTHYYLKS